MDGDKWCNVYYLAVNKEPISPTTPATRARKNRGKGKPASPPLAHVSIPAFATSITTNRATSNKICGELSRISSLHTPCTTERRAPFLCLREPSVFPRYIHRVPYDKHKKNSGLPSLQQRRHSKSQQAATRRRLEWRRGGCDRILTISPVPLLY